MCICMYFNLLVPTVFPAKLHEYEHVIRAKSISRLVEQLKMNWQICSKCTGSSFSHVQMRWFSESSMVQTK